MLSYIWHSLSWQSNVFDSRRWYGHECFIMGFLLFCFVFLPVQSSVSQSSFHESNLEWHTLSIRFAIWRPGKKESERKSRFISKNNRLKKKYDISVACYCNTWFTTKVLWNSDDHWWCPEILLQEICLFFFFFLFWVFFPSFRLCTLSVTFCPFLFETQES